MAHLKHTLIVSLKLFLVGLFDLGDADTRKPVISVDVQQVTMLAGLPDGLLPTSLEGLVVLFLIPFLQYPCGLPKLMGSNPPPLLDLFEIILAFVEPFVELFLLALTEMTQEIKRGAYFRIFRHQSFFTPTG